MVIIEVEISHQWLWSSLLMSNTIVERGRCFHAVGSVSVCESGSDLFLMRSTISCSRTLQVLCENSGTTAGAESCFGDGHGGSIPRESGLDR